MSLKEWLFRVKVFAWFMVTEPFRELMGVWFHLERALNKTFYWALYLLVIVIVALIFGSRLIAALFLVLVLVLLLINEWKSGRFMARWRAYKIESLKRKERRDKE